MGCVRVCGYVTDSWPGQGGMCVYHCETAGMSAMLVCDLADVSFESACVCVSVSGDVW